MRSLAPRSAAPSGSRAVAARTSKTERPLDTTAAGVRPASGLPLLAADALSRIPVFPPGAHASSATLAISNVDDYSEREAERAGRNAATTRSVMPVAAAMPGSSHDRVPAERIQPALSSPSHALESSVREQFESAFGHNFSSVRIHTGPAATRSAEDLDATAYTVGTHIVFGPASYQPHTRTGRQLLAHELSHVVQQAAGVPMLQRNGKKKAAPAQKMSPEDAEAWFKEMNVDEAFADPSIPGAEADLAQAIEDYEGKSLTPEEMHRQLLTRRAQPLGASAYQAADPVAEMADMQRKIRNAQAKIRTRKKNLAALGKGQAAKADRDALKAEISALEDEVDAIKTARARLPKATQFSRIGKGAPAGTGEITYAGIQIETAEGKRIALEFAETTSTEHAEEVMIGQIEQKLTKEQLKGARVTVVGDQVVCGERCTPALQKFAERNGVESVDGFVFRRAEILTKGAMGPPELASPRTTLRTMTEAKSAGRELFREQKVIYRKPPAEGAASAAGQGAEHAAAADAGKAAAKGAEGTAVKSAEQPVVKSAEQQVAKTAERTASKDARVILKAIAENYIKQLKSITPTKVLRFGGNFIKEGIKGFVTAKAVDWIIGDSNLEDDIAALDAANHAPHNDTPEKIRAYTKEAVSWLPPQIAIIVAGAIRNIAPLNAEFLYNATVQENKRDWEKFKEEYGDSDEAAHLYDQSLKAADDLYNGTIWDQ